MLENSYQQWAADQVSRLPRELQTTETSKNQATSSNLFDSMPITQWQTELTELRNESPELAEQRELEIITEIKKKLIV